MADVLPMRGPLWRDVGYWSCPFCLERHKRAYGLIPGLTFGPDGGYKVGRCGCGYWARFDGKLGYASGLEQGEVLGYGR